VCVCVSVCVCTGVWCLCVCFVFVHVCMHAHGLLLHARRSMPLFLRRILCRYCNEEVPVIPFTTAQSYILEIGIVGMEKKRDKKASRR
jgi:hypothetical protein